ncbi:molluscan insulin-related peptide 7 [Plakobranchus ocellatus]|uniref:Molluscan insulin-related peptide 7 n=1 Tax=Plakobranchus ocellatus TaxID=259542 RepID=A0AAV4ANH9_9GAST|nr:molluscan insulin-related peptide 7 [Plakobranchus ocellatus]
MIVSVKDILPVAALLSAFYLHGARASRCNFYRNTPHPEGICGGRLSQLHSNVCLLVRIMHPEFFNNSSSAAEKRSSLELGQRGHTETIAQLVNDIAKRAVKERGLDLTDSYKNGDTGGYVDHMDSFMRGDYGDNYDENDGGILDKLLGISSEKKFTNKRWIASILRRTAENNKRNKRATGEHSGAVLSRRKRDLVCDCCYNQCTMETVALYC